MRLIVSERIHHAVTRVSHFTRQQISMGHGYLSGSLENGLACGKSRRSTTNLSNFHVRLLHSPSLSTPPHSNQFHATPFHATQPHPTPLNRTSNTFFGTRSTGCRLFFWKKLFLTAANPITTPNRYSSPTLATVISSNHLGAIGHYLSRWAALGSSRYPEGRHSSLRRSSRTHPTKREHHSDQACETELSCSRVSICVCAWYMYMVLVYVVCTGICV